MAENNPLKYKDLIQADDSIDKAIAKLGALQVKYNELHSTVIGEADSAKKAVEGLSVSTDAERKALTEAAKEAEKMAKAEKDLASARSENAKKLVELSLEKQKVQRLNKLQAKLNAAEAGSYDAVSAQYSMNIIKLNQMGEVWQTTTEEGKAFVAVTAELFATMKRLKGATGDMRLNVANYPEMEKQVGKLTQKIRANRDEMAKLLLAGEGMSPRYKQLLAETGAYEDAMADAARATKALASDTGKLDVIMSGATAASGAFSAGIGAMQLFGGESEEVQEAQRKLQATIAITTGLTQVQNAVQKESAVMLGITRLQTMAQAKAEAIRATVTATGTKATKAATLQLMLLNAVAKMNPYVILALALVTVVGALWAFSKGSKDSKEAQEKANAETERANELSTETAKGMAGQVALFKRLQLAYIATGGSIKAQKKFIKDSADEFKTLGVQIKTVADAENLLIHNAGAFIQAMQMKAKAAAGQKLAEKRYEEALLAQEEFLRKQAEADEKAKQAAAAPEDTITTTVSGDVVTQFQTTQKAELQEAAANLQLQANILGLKVQALQGEAANFVGISIQDTENFTAVIDKLGITAEETEKKTVKSKKDYAKELTEWRIKNIQDERKRALAEAEQQAKLDIDAIRLVDGKEIKLTEQQTAVIAEIEIFKRNRIEAINKEYDTRELETANEQALAILNAEREYIDLHLAMVAEGSEEEIALRVKLLRKQQEIELLENQTRAENLRQSESDINAKYDKLVLNETSNLSIQRSMLVFDQQQELASSEFALLEKSERQKTQFALEQEKARLEKILSLNEIAGGQMTDLQIQTMKNTIAGINQEIKKNTKPNDFYDAIGLNISDDQKEAINATVSFVKEQLTLMAQANIEAANTAVENANKVVESAERTLDAERQKAINGLANQEDTANRELEIAKQTRQKALNDQKKAQRELATIQAIEQAGSLVTAAAQIFATIVFPWSLPVVGAMLAAFALTKIKAAKATKSQSFGDGTVELIKSGSHASGNDMSLGIGSDGVERRVEGGEYFAVFTKKAGRKNNIPDIVNSINQGKFNEKYGNVFDVNRNVTVTKSGTDLRGLQREVSQIKEQGERRTVIEDGRTVQYYKNQKTIIN